MNHSGAMQLKTQGDREIVVTRMFNAPRQLVWDAHTKPELVKRWLSGPPGWAMTVCDIDLRVGGKYRWVWSGPNGEIMGMGGVHREIAAPERLANTQLFDEDWTGGEAEGLLILTERDGITTLTNTVRYSTPEARTAALQTPMEMGMAMGYDRLETVLAAL